MFCSAEVSMFIHFDSTTNPACDDCGNPTSVMHMSSRRSPCDLNLCIACFRALALAMAHASKKLGPAWSEAKSVNP